jgi:hypothetical protein
MNHSELIAAGIGHPITNLLMSQANAGDMGAADHADAGAVVDLVEPAGVVSGHATEGQVVQVDYALKYARKTLSEMCYGDMITQEMVNAAAFITGMVDMSDQVDQGAAGDDLADHLLELENLVEGARDAVVRRLEQFDDIGSRVTRIDARAARIEEMLARMMCHFGEGA